MSEVEHGRLREAAGELVSARDNDVSTTLQRTARKGRVKAEMSSPRLVDNKWHSMSVRDFAQRANIRDRPEVGRANYVRSRAVWMLGECCIEYLRGHSMCDAKDKIDGGKGEMQSHPGAYRAIDYRRVH